MNEEANPMCAPMAASAIGMIADVNAQAVAVAQAREQASAAAAAAAAKAGHVAMTSRQRRQAEMDEAFRIAAKLNARVRKDEAEAAARREEALYAHAQKREEAAAKLNARTRQARPKGSVRLEDFPTLVAAAEALAASDAANGSPEDVEKRIAAALERAKGLFADGFGGGLREPKP